MEPSPTPPWRSLEAPSETTSVTPPERAPGGVPPATRTVLLAGLGVVGCAVLALVLAFGGGSSGAVAIDGGEALGSPDPGGSAGPAGGAVGGGSRALVVEIVGAVPDPGVYRLPPGSRVGDLIAAAGGYGPRVDTARVEQELNLAAAVSDGDRVRVPSRDDPPTSGPAPAAGVLASPGAAGGPVDLNRASADQLDALPGVGPVTVQKILDARAEAPFTTIDELQSRGIVGAKTLDKLRSLVTVG